MMFNLLRKLIFFPELPFFKTRVNHSAGLGIASKNSRFIDIINEEWFSNLKIIDGILKHVCMNIEIDSTDFGKVPKNDPNLN